jgi:hypothetical protein
MAHFLRNLNFSTNSWLSWPTDFPTSFFNKEQCVAPFIVKCIFRGFVGNLDPKKLPFLTTNVGHVEKNAQILLRIRKEHEK